MRLELRRSPRRGLLAGCSARSRSRTSGPLLLVRRLRAAQCRSEAVPRAASTSWRSRAAIRSTGRPAAAALGRDPACRPPGAARPGPAPSKGLGELPLSRRCSFSLASSALRLGPAAAPPRRTPRASRLARGQAPLELGCTLAELALDDPVELLLARLDSRSIARPRARPAAGASAPASRRGSHEPVAETASSTLRARARRRPTRQLPRGRLRRRRPKDCALLRVGRRAASTAAAAVRRAAKTSLQRGLDSHRVCIVRRRAQKRRRTTRAAASATTARVIARRAASGAARQSLGGQARLPPSRARSCRRRAPPAAAPSGPASTAAAGRG